MTSSHKYNRSEGCCICATKNSTSQFRPWYDHYTEEIYCRVFKLDRLDGRRGYVCNPCVLYIKRAVQSLENPSREQLGNPPDHTKRLDCKLKGGTRTVITDIWPPDSVGAPLSLVPLKERCGFFSRHMKFRPRFVFTGKPFVKLKSTFQLIPAGPWRDPRELLEDEDDAEKELKYYRMVTLKKEAKTLREKAEESRKREALENAKLFGKVKGGLFCHSSHCMTTNECEQNDNHWTRTKGRKAASQSSNRRTQHGKKVTQNNIRNYGTRANVSREKHTAEEDDENSKGDVWEDTRCFDQNDADSEFDDELANEDDDGFAETEEGKSPSDSTEDLDETICSLSVAEINQNIENSELSAVSVNTSKVIAQDRKRKYLWTDMETSQEKYICTSKDHQQLKERIKDPQNISSLEHQFCKREYRRNRRCLQAPVKNLKPRKVSFMDCSYWQKFRLCCVDLYVGQGPYAVIRPHIRLKPCPVMLKHIHECKEKMKGRNPAAETDIHTAANIPINLELSKEMEVAKVAQVSSPLSSGDDEMNDSRNNFTSSPLVEASLSMETFHFFEEHHKRPKTNTGTSS